MTRRWIWVAAAVAVAVSADDAMAKKPQSAKAPLVRPDVSPPDDDAKGRVEIRDHKNEGRFEVKAMALDTAGTFDVLVEDGVGAGTFTSVGQLALDDGDLKLRLDEDGAGLPLGVGAAAELVGRGVRVESGAQVFLQGVIPDFPPKNVNKGGAWSRGKVAMTRPVATPPDDDAKGTLEVRTKKKDNRDRFTVKAQKLPTDTVTFHLFLEDAVGSMTFVDLGAMDVDDDGDLRFDVDTWSGAPLPGGVADVEELAGRALEVRGDDTFTYLGTTVPAFFEGKKKKAKAKFSLAGAGGSAKATVESHAQAPYERLSMKIETTVIDGTVDLFVEDPSSSTLTVVASLETDGSGKAKFSVSTKSGAPLPFGANLSELDGMAVEVRDTGGGTLMSGTFAAP